MSLVNFSGGRRTGIVLLAVLISVCGVLAVAGAATTTTLQAKRPITKQGLIKAIRLNALTTKELVQHIEARGVEFQMTAADEAELRGAGARPEVIEAARAAYRGGSSSTSSQTTVANNTNSGREAVRPPANVPTGPPLSKNEIITLLQSGVAAARVEQFVEARGVNFSSTPQITREIMAAGGTRSLIGAISERAVAEPPPSNNTFGDPNVNARRGPDYDDLTDQATNMMDNDANGAVRLLQQAIQMDQTQPTAYTLLGLAQLYYQRNIGAAVAPMRAAIERGGAAAFRVYHDHDGAFGQHCQGSFFVTKTGVSFKADDGNDTFEVEDANIKEAKTNALVGAAYGAFHVKLTKESGGRNYNFAPATQQKVEGELITTLIKQY